MFRLMSTDASVDFSYRCFSKIMNLVFCENCLKPLTIFAKNLHLRCSTEYQIRLCWSLSSHKNIFPVMFFEFSKYLICRTIMNDFLFDIFLEVFSFLFEAISFLRCQKLIFENLSLKNNQFS